MHSAYITLSNLLLWKYSTLNYLWNGILWWEILLDVRPGKEDQRCLNHPDHHIIFVPTLDFFICTLKSNTVHTEQKCVTLVTVILVPSPSPTCSIESCKTLLFRQVGIFPEKALICSYSSLVIFWRQSSRIHVGPRVIL